MQPVSRRSPGLGYYFRLWWNRRNWPLFFGGLIVLMLLLVAYKGSDWAPQDPMQEHYSLAVRGQIVRPPYPAFTIPGFPLGTDQFGRDLLSRILWGVRPTMIVVGVVALTRLALGIIMGLVMGWSQGAGGRLLESGLSLALSIPVLFVALMGINAVGIQAGLGAFIFGLSLNGWAETARLVSDQTRITMKQEYVEAARALGASDRRVLFSHVLKQIMPLIWMLFAFEASASLLITAELGFLGYYIGGGVWIELSDFYSVNTTGLPELGQMLATSLVTLVKPGVLIVIGSVIFFAILGFNLLGEGLRQRASRPAQAGLRSLLLRGRLGARIERNLSFVVADFLETQAVRVGLGFLIVSVIVGGWLWLQRQPEAHSSAGLQQITVPGGHLWATERHDAQGTRWTSARGPQKAEILWAFQAPGGLTGGPVVTSTGTLILAAMEQELIAIDPGGNVIWRANLPEIPVGTPALGPEGQIYVTDQLGGLSAFDQQGQPIWYFDAPGQREATSGPIVASDGMIYYTRVDAILAVSPQGEQKWVSSALREYYEIPPILSAGESFIFLRNNALAASSGAPLALEGLQVSELEFTVPTFFVGADAKTYFRAGHQAFAWRSTESGVEIDPAVTWNYENQVLVPPYDQGVTPEQLVWFFYGGDYFDTRLVWLDLKNRLLVNTRILDRQSRLLAIDRDSVAHYCSSNFSVNIICAAIQLGSDKPDWEVHLVEAGSGYVGGALVEGRVYAATGGGILYAIGEN